MAELVLDAGRLQPNHRAADQLRLEVDFVVAFTMPTESSGYEQTVTTSGLAAAMPRITGVKSVVLGG